MDTSKQISRLRPSHGGGFFITAVTVCTKLSRGITLMAKIKYTKLFCPVFGSGNT